MSRPANTPPGTVPVPQCTNPTNHLLRFAGIGRQDTAFFFCADPCAAFVSHDCMPLVDCLPQYVIAGKLLCTSGGEKRKTTMQTFDSRTALKEGVCVENLETEWPLAYVLYESHVLSSVDAEMIIYHSMFMYVQGDCQRWLKHFQICVSCTLNMPLERFSSHSHFDGLFIALNVSLKV